MWIVYSFMCDMHRGFNKVRTSYEFILKSNRMYCSKIKIGNNLSSVFDESISITNYTSNLRI